jgi:hypothetical protein
MVSEEDWKLHLPVNKIIKQQPKVKQTKQREQTKTTPSNNQVNHQTNETIHKTKQNNKQANQNNRRKYSLLFILLL